MASSPATTVASVVRLLDAMARIGRADSYPGTVLPLLADVIECDALTYGEVGAAGAVRRLDHVARTSGAAGAARHRLTLTLVVPGRCLVGITLRRDQPAFGNPERELLEALRAPLAAGLARVQARDLDPPPAPPQEALSENGLTAREHQVLELVALGRTNLAIAHALGISPRTVGKHLEHSYRKLAVSSRAAAVATLR